MKFRHKIGQDLVKLGMKIYGESELEPPKRPQDNRSIFADENHDAVVEADDTIEQWQPEQKGNVVIVEPDLMREYRRGKLS